MKRGDPGQSRGHLLDAGDVTPRVTQGCDSRGGDVDGYLAALETASNAAHDAARALSQACHAARDRGELTRQLSNAYRWACDAANITAHAHADARQRLRGAP